MDLTSSVRTDTLPAVASVLIPGVGALAPYAAVLARHRPELAKWFESHEATGLIGAVLLTVGTGFLIESLGSYIEFYIIDRRHKDRDAMMAKFWQYLRIAWKTEPTGQHYLRRLLAVFTFELNGFTAVIVAFPGLSWFAFAANLGMSKSVGLILPVVVLGAYLFHAATQTSFLLAELREHLLLGVGEPPFQRAESESA